MVLSWNGEADFNRLRGKRKEDCASDVNSAFCKMIDYMGEDNLPATKNKLEKKLQKQADVTTKVGGKQYGEGRHAKEGAVAYILLLYSDDFEDATSKIETLKSFYM